MIGRLWYAERPKCGTSDLLLEEGLHIHSCARAADGGWWVTLICVEHLDDDEIDREHALDLVRDGHAVMRACYLCGYNIPLLHSRPHGMCLCPLCRPHRPTRRLAIRAAARRRKNKRGY